jgi:hypothetical protein
VPLCKIQAAFNVPFNEEWLLSGYSTIKAWLVECCRDGCPSERFSHRRRVTLELSQSDNRFLGHLPPLLPRLLSLAGRPALGRVLVVPNFFHIRVMEATVCLGTFNAVDICWSPSPDLCLDTILSWSSTDNSFDLMAWFLLWHALSTVGPYIDSCVPFQTMSNQLNLPQVDSNQVVEISQGWSMETGCTWTQFWVL